MWNIVKYTFDENWSDPRGSYNLSLLRYSYVHLQPTWKDIFCPGHINWSIILYWILYFWNHSISDINEIVLHTNSQYHSHGYGCLHFAKTWQIRWSARSQTVPSVWFDYRNRSQNIPYTYNPTFWDVLGEWYMVWLVPPIVIAMLIRTPKVHKSVQMNSPAACTW